MRPPLTPLALLPALLFWPTPAPAAPDDRTGLEFFEKKVRPILVEHCYGCHSAAKKQRGGLALDTRNAIRQGGDTGPAVVPGNVADSLLLKAVRNLPDGLKMPPRGKLTDSAIADLEQWVKMGAPDPRHAGGAAVVKGIDVNAGRTFWAFQPPVRRPIPEVKNAAWPRTDVDRFLLARLEASKIVPGADSDRTALLRRVYFDLVGLPPAPEQIDAFLGEKSAAAFEKVVDGLLASPHFGERWGRHWLDVARYADSSGGGRSLLFPNAWRYRDYVINSLNRNRPYDRFIAEQIAGDLLPYQTPEERRDQVTATGFLALGPTNYEGQDKTVLEMDVIDEQLDTIGRTFLGLTIGCARCHDHKFDPIPTRDYYALAGIFRSTQTLIHDNVSRWVDQPLPMPPEQEAAVQKHEAAVAALKEKIKIAKEAEKKADAKADGSKKLEEELKKLTAAAPPRPVAMGVKEANKIGDICVCIRGNVNNQGEKAPRGFLRVLTAGNGPAIPAKASGRRQLAAWLASPDNPLTARVLVNRVWHHLFGAGLVRTVDEFGATGEPPSHPELLDHLAVRFVQEGWSVKKLVRTLVLSRAYGLSSVMRAEGLAIDPENRLLWRANRRRLEAECIRDAVLAVSGQLNPCTGGPTMKKGTESEYTYVFTETGRGVFVPVFRNKLPEVFEAFDFPDPNLVVGRRNASTVSTQALFLLNSPFMMDQARHAARTALADPKLDDAARVERAYRVTLGRLPAERERQIALAAVAGKTRPEERLAAWERLYQALFASSDFRYVY